MAGYVGKLEPGDRLDATPYFDGPWKSFERIALDGGQSRRFDGATEEYAIFVVGGAGEYQVFETTAAATPGTSLTVGLGASVTITAAAPGIDLFVTTLSVTPL